MAYHVILGPNHADPGPHPLHDLPRSLARRGTKLRNNQTNPIWIHIKLLLIPVQALEELQVVRRAVGNRREFQVTLIPSLNRVAADLARSHL